MILENGIHAYQTKQKIRSLLTAAFRYAFLIAIGYIIVVQLTSVISHAFRSNEDINNPSVIWVPIHFTLENFQKAFDVIDFVSTFFRTFFVQILSGLVEVFTCAVAAYGFARFEFTGKKLMFSVVIVMILLPPQMIAIPMYLNYAHFDLFGILKLLGNAVGKELRPNLLDTPLTFWMPSIFGVGLRSGLFIFIYRQFFLGLPKELEEAASIDGANAFETFMRVVLPSSGVAFLTVTIFSVVWHWNDYYLSVLYFTDKYPMSVKLMRVDSALGFLLNSTELSHGIKMAGTLIFVFPPLVLYIILQRKFIASVDKVGIVG